MTSKRGRVSTAALIAGPAQSDANERTQRPISPHDLIDEEVEVWAAVVNAMPADWFNPTNLPLLTQYSRHCVQARRIAEWIEKATAIPAELKIRDYDRLLKMQTRESAAIASLAVKMRLSQSACRNDRGNRRDTPPAHRPWEG